MSGVQHQRVCSTTTTISSSFSGRRNLVVGNRRNTRICQDDGESVPFSMSTRWRRRQDWSGCVAASTGREVPRFIQHKNEAKAFYAFLSQVYDYIVNPGRYTIIIIPSSSSSMFEEENGHHGHICRTLDC